MPKCQAAAQFSQEMHLTREQMATILFHYAKWKNFSLEGELKTFTDAENISTYAEDAVEAVVRAGIMNGHTDGSFDPKGKATRAEVATVLVNFAKKYLEG